MIHNFTTDLIESRNVTNLRCTQNITQTHTLITAFRVLYSNYHLAVILIFRDIDKKIVTLPEIRETGEYVAEFKLHPEVSAKVRLTVFGN